MRHDTPQGFATAALLLACLVLGGGQGTVGDMACQLGALALLAWVLWRHANEEAARLPRVAWLAALPFLLPVLQLMPLPEAAWMMPPAREGLAEGLAAAGATVPSRWSLLPSATERAALWMLPAAAMFLSVLQLDETWRKRLLGVLVAFAAASVVLGIAQLAGGEQSALRFYAITNPTEAVGLFANRNHFASLLAVCLPIVLVGLAASVRAHPGDDTAHRLLRIAAGLGLAVLLILGIALARSRAGVLLGMLGLLLSLPVAWGLQRGGRRVLAVAVGLGAVLAVQFALYGLMQRFEKDPFEDGRFQYAGVAAEVAGAHGPLGTGLGGFRRAFEAADPAPGRSYVNHAHNDALQLWLEGGWAGGAMVAGVAGLLLVSGWTAWRRRDGHEAIARALPRVAWVGLLLLALHSLADYPLRTTAMLASAGLFAAVLAGGLRKIQPSPGLAAAAGGA